MGSRLLLLLIVLFSAACGLDSSAAAPDAAPFEDSGPGDSAVGDSVAGDSRADDGATADATDEDSAVADSGAADSGASDTSMVDGDVVDTAVGDTGLPTCSTPPPGSGVAVALPAPAGIAVDGDLSDWSWSEAVGVGLPDFRSRGGPDPGSAADFSATVAVLWTADTLYFAVVVADDAHYNESAADLIWEGDSVQLAFDVANDDVAPYDGVNDFEYGWAQTSAGTQRWRWTSPVGASVAGDTVTIVRGSGDTTYEGRLAASDLGLTRFSAGDSFGFAWIVNEMDGAGTSEGFSEWTSGIGYFKDPSLFGDLVLRDCD